MGRPGTVRKDNLTTCRECGEKFRPCNIERHVKAAHPDSPLVGQFESERIREMIRGRR